ncbi:MAG: SURF1 family cytochrome oxidase biogenesis protein [Erythrobacter sp.]|jgi:surfeit locus 1 family protein
MRVPVLPTVVVAAAVATMIALGLWQLDRMEQKEALIARYAAAQAIADPVNFPADPQEREALLYRKTSVACARVANVTTVAGKSARGESGVAQRASCLLPGGEPVTVDLGFSRAPQPIAWNGGMVDGVIAPGGRVVASEGVAGLAPLARPDPQSLPNNHFAYAVQWFLFAATALVIYVLALRRSLKVKI